MKILLLLVVLFLSSCSTYISETEKKELDIAARRLFTDKQVLGTRIVRNKELYSVSVDLAGEPTKYVRCRRFENDGGQYWNCQK